MEGPSKFDIRFVQEAIENSGETAVDRKYSVGKDALCSRAAQWEEMLRKECYGALAEVEDSVVREMLSAYLEELLPLRSW